MKVVKTKAVLAGILVLVLLPGCGPEEADGPETADTAAEGTGLEVAGVGLAGPESVLHDGEEDVYLVSNVAGQPLEADGNGFISRISPEGEVVELRWIDGEDPGVTLHAPKGLALVDDLLYVSDVDALRRFDRSTGEPMGQFSHEGALLNDLCAGDDGTVHWTETGLTFGEEGQTPTGSDAVYALREDSLVVFAQGSGLGNPNGCVVDGSDVVYASFTSNQIRRLSEDGTSSIVAELPAGGLDGLVQAGGAWYVTSWEASAVYRVEVPEEGAPEITTPVSGIASPADLGHDAGRNRVMVPLLQEDRIVFHELE